jgi:guanine deaminase
MAARGGKKCLLGGIIHSLRLGLLETIENGAIIFNQQGVIEQVLDLNQPQPHDHPLQDISPENLFDYRGKLILPGFVDSHCHAPQYVFTGTGIDMDLMEWLQTYTFPIESKFCDENYAKVAYTKSVQRHLKNGTTFAAYYATIHKEAALLLTEIINSVGQRAFVGKVAMDQNSPETYIETTEESVDGTEAFLRGVLKQTNVGTAFLTEIDHRAEGPSEDLSPSAFSSRPTLLNTSTCPLVLPCITPRFVPTCTSTSLHGLGRLSHKYGLPVQSHISESLNEINFVRSLHPTALTYGHIYHTHGLLHQSTLLGHCVHCSDLELQLIRDTHTSAVHCASSNFLLGSGIMDVRRFLDAGIPVGLGTDVAGGASTSMLDCIRNTISASRAMGMKKRGDGIPPPFSELPQETLSVEELTNYR